MFLSQVLVRAGIQGINFLSVFVILALTNRVLGVEGRGLLAAALSWGNLFLTLGHLSLPFVILNALPQAQPEQRGRVSGTVLLAGLALGGLTVLIGWLAFRVMAVRWFGHLTGRQLLLALAPLPFMMAQQNLAAVFQSLGQLWQFNLLTLANALASLGLALAALWAGLYTVENGLAIVLVVQAIVFAISIGLARRLFPGSWRPDPAWLARGVRDALTAHVGSVTSFVFLKADLLLVNALLGQDAAGLYAVAALMVAGLQVVPMTIQSIVYAQVAEGSPAEATERVLRVSRMTCALMMMVSVALLPLAYPIVYVLGNKAFLGAVPVFWALLPGTLCLSSAFVMGPLWVRLGLFRWLSTVCVLLALASLSLELLFIPRWGLVGAALASSLAQVFGLVLVLRNLTRLTRHRWWEPLLLTRADLLVLARQFSDLRKSLLRLNEG